MAGRAASTLTSTRTGPTPGEAPHLTLTKATTGGRMVHETGNREVGTGRGRVLLEAGQEAWEAEQCPRTAAIGNGTPGVL